MRSGAVFAILALSLGACADPPPPPLDGDRVLSHVEVLADRVGPREYLSTSAERAVEYLEAQLRAIGVASRREPVGLRQVPRVEAAGFLVFEARQVLVPTPNLVAEIPGTDPDLGRPLVIMAHYDTVKASPGAVDNGVGVALLVELARHLKANPPARPVWLVWTAAEEVGLVGAIAFAERTSERVGLALSVDLVGGDGPVTLNGLSPLMGYAWLTWLAGVADRSGATLAAPLLQRAVSRRFPALERSDHREFTLRDVPAFHIYNRDPDDPVYLPYHSPWDTPDRVRRSAVDDAGRFLVALASQPGPLPAAGGDAGLWLPVGRHRVVGLLTVQVIELGLLMIAGYGFVQLLRRRSRREGHRGVGLVLAVGAHVVAFAALWGLLDLEGALWSHPRPWVHAPGRHLLGAALLLGGGVTAATFLLRGARWVVGEVRFLALAMLGLMVVGIGLLLFRIEELAWIPLASAALLGGSAFAERRWIASALLAAGVLPLLLLLRPALLREMLFNGFFPPVVPLAGYLALVTLPITLTIVHAVRRFRHRERGPLGWRSPLVAGGLAVAAIGLAVLLTAPPACEGRTYLHWGLTCEVVESAP